MFLITGLGHGGAETQLVRISCALKKRGWNVSIVTMLSPESKPLLAKLDACKIPLKNLALKDIKTTLKGVGKLLRILEKSKPDVLVSFLFHANILGSLVAPMAGISRHITSIRGASFGSEKRIKFAKFFHQFDAQTTVNSKGVADTMIQDNILKSHKVSVVYNAIDVENFSPQSSIREKIRQELSLNENIFLFLAIGRIHPVKGYDDLVEACRGLPENIKLMIVGKVENENLQNKIDAYKIRDRVKLLGFRNDISDLMCAADGVVLSSLSEGLPNVLIEAHAAKLPIVATRVGGVEEIVEEGKTGFIVPPGNVIALQNAMEKLALLPLKKRKAMGVFGYEHVHASFGLETIMNRWESLLLNR